MIERDEKGRYVKGWKGGPGRHAKSREEKYRSIFSETIPPEKFKACCYQIWLDSVGKKLSDDGKLVNDPQSTPYTRTNAFGRIAAYAIGKPIQPVLFDSAEGELLEVFREMSDESLNEIIEEGELRKYMGVETKSGADVLSRFLDLSTKGAYVNVDVIGIGSSVYDLAKQQNMKVQAINWAESSNQTDKSGKLRFANKRAEHTWKFREALDPEGGNNLALPNDPELLADLCSIRWKMKSSGIAIESKEEIKRRIGRSPDCGDLGELRRRKDRLSAHNNRSLQRRRHTPVASVAPYSAVQLSN